MSLELVKGDVEFRNVDFSYEEGNKVLDDIRLTDGMIAFKYQFDPEEFIEKIHSSLERCLEINQITHHGKIRLQVYRSGEGAYMPLENKPFYLLEGYSLKTDYFNGTPPFSLCGFRDFNLHHSPYSRFKTCNSLPYVMAGIYAQEQNTDDAVLFSGDHISETSIANIFLVSNRKILTPPLDSGCLDGVMRKQILELAKSLKIPAVEKKLRRRDLLQADEVFLTNTLRGIIPVKRFEQTQWETKNYGITPFLQKCLLQYIHAKG